MSGSRYAYAGCIMAMVVADATAEQKISRDIFEDPWCRSGADLFATMAQSVPLQEIMIKSFTCSGVDRSGRNGEKAG